MQKLLDFFLLDRTYRLKTYAFASLLAILYALVSLFMLQKDEREVGLFTVTILYSSVGLSIAHYVFLRKQETQRTAPTLLRGLLRPSLAIAASAVIYVIISSNTQSQVIAAQLQMIANQSEPLFQSSLAHFERTLRAANRHGVSSDPNLLNTLAYKLAHADSTQPNYWPALVEFLNYRNRSLTPDLARKLKSRDSIPRCTDKPPSSPVVIEVPAPNKLKIRNAVYESCRVTLDNPADEARINYFLATMTASMEFKDSLVEYHGGPFWINLLQDADDPTRKISTLYFTNCFFDFSVEGTPPSDAQRALQILLLNQDGNIALPPGALITY
jgi:hypothetical protein